jgi:hypothetical protein
MRINILCLALLLAILDVLQGLYAVHVNRVFGLWCLTPLSTKNSYNVAVSFIGGANRSTTEYPHTYKAGQMHNACGIDCLM